MSGAVPESITLRVESVNNTQVSKLFGFLYNRLFRYFPQHHNPCLDIILSYLSFEPNDTFVARRLDLVDSIRVLKLLGTDLFCLESVSNTLVMLDCARKCEAVYFSLKADSTSLLPFFPGHNYLIERKKDLLFGITTKRIDLAEEDGSTPANGYLFSSWTITESVLTLDKCVVLSDVTKPPTSLDYSSDIDSFIIGHEGGEVQLITPEFDLTAPIKTGATQPKSCQVSREKPTSPLILTVCDTKGPIYVLKDGAPLHVARDISSSSFMGSTALGDQWTQFSSFRFDFRKSKLVATTIKNPPDCFVGLFAGMDNSGFWTTTHNRQTLQARLVFRANDVVCSNVATFSIDIDFNTMTAYTLFSTRGVLLIRAQAGETGEQHVFYVSFNDGPTPPKFDFSNRQTDWQVVEFPPAPDGTGSATTSTAVDLYS